MENCDADRDVGGRGSRPRSVPLNRLRWGALAAAVIIVIVAFIFTGGSSSSSDKPVPRTKVASGRQGGETWAMFVYTQSRSANTPGGPTTDLCASLEFKSGNANQCGPTSVFKSYPGAPGVLCKNKMLWFYGVGTGQVASARLEVGSKQRLVQTMPVAETPWRSWAAELGRSQTIGTASVLDASGHILWSGRPGIGGPCP
jgi:hypothetical protein